MIKKIKSNKLVKVKIQRQLGLFKEVHCSDDSIKLYKVEKTELGDTPVRMNLFGGDGDDN